MHGTTVLLKLTMNIYNVKVNVSGEEVYTKIHLTLMATNREKE